MTLGTLHPQGTVPVMCVVAPPPPPPVHGYLKHPPARNRNPWQKFIERNRALAKNNYKVTSKHVKHILQIREIVWNSLLNVNRSRDGADALNYKGVVYALLKGTISTFNFPFSLSRVPNPFCRDL